MLDKDGAKSTRKCLITCFTLDLIDKSVVVLQYVDDTIFCIKHHIKQDVHFKLLLYMFELMSVLKITYLKSKIVIIGGDNYVANLCSEMFNCHVGFLPMK
jgi:hypothetical protein